MAVEVVTLPSACLRSSPHSSVVEVPVVVVCPVTVWVTVVVHWAHFLQPEAANAATRATDRMSDFMVTKIRINFGFAALWQKVND